MKYEDKWCWRGDIRGLYSVKNGYRSLFELPDNTGTASWSHIWKLKVHPAVHNFLWRCLRKVLPVLTALFVRRAAVDVSCPLCHNHAETLDHLMKECSCVAPLWQIVMNGHTPDQGDDCAAWLLDTLAHGETLFKLRVVAVWWCIWRARNETVWNNKPWQLSSVVHEVYRCLGDWQNLMSGAPALGAGTYVLQNVVTGQDDAVKVFVDAAVFPSVDIAYFGCLILNPSGGFLAARNGPLRCMSGAHLAEALAIKEALSWIKDKGYTKIKLYSDCQMVCSLLNGSGTDWSYVGCVIGACKVLSRHFESVSFEFVSRSVNQCAHALARAASSQTGPACWISSIPTCITHLL